MSGYYHLKNALLTVGDFSNDEGKLIILKHITLREMIKLQDGIVILLLKKSFVLLSLVVIRAE